MDADPDVVGKKCTLKEALELRSTLLSSVTTLSAEVNRRQALKRGLGGGKRPCRKYIELAEVYGSTLPPVRCTYEDRLCTTQAQIRNLEGSKRQSVRRRGFPVVVRERADRPDEVPVTSVRKYWQPIVGEARPFGVSRQLKQWSNNLGTSDNPEKAQELSNEEWRCLFSKVKPWKGTGPDGIQGFW
ncbi:hypothetical protein ANCDUO_22208 [Ancylostoma duodenale]|uniref:Uncharacterized protein n=1 Tax=Ancylostoma duodenale TaxID=51022 RepID=A0A0C2CCX9_9BILA|nr:hypothetical protein ANCDUO_22208 [Ancylostoma duodenale]